MLSCMQIHLILFLQDLIYSFMNYAEEETSSVISCV